MVKILPANAVDLISIPGSGKYPGGGNATHSTIPEGGNRQNRLHLGLDCGLSYMPSICGNNIPTGKPDPPEGRAPGLIPRLSLAEKNTLITCVTE